jgi:hypothetical protein
MTSANHINRVGVEVCQSRRKPESKKQARINRVGVNVCQSRRKRERKNQPDRFVGGRSFSSGIKSRKSHGASAPEDSSGIFLQVLRLVSISVHLCSSVVPRLGFCGELR